MTPVTQLLLKSCIYFEIAVLLTLVLLLRLQARVPEDRVQKSERGFSLVELLMVLAIIGILAAIAIPNLLTAISKAKQKRTLLDIKTIAVAWEARATDMNRYNAAGSIDGVSIPLSISTLAAGLEPTYSRKLPHVDGWGQPFTCLIDQPWGSSAPASRYVIISGGADRVISPGINEGTFTNFDCDIVYTNGVFLAYPEGAQIAAH